MRSPKILLARTFSARPLTLFAWPTLALLMLALLALLIFAFGLGPLAMIGVAAVLVLLSYEHSLVSKDDLSRLNAAFFTMNGVIAVVFFIFLALDLILHHSGTI